MVYEVIIPVKTKRGTLKPGQRINVTESVADTLADNVRPLTFGKLSAAERGRWCLDHELTQPGCRCPHKGKLDGCVLWRNITRRERFRSVTRHRWEI